MSVTDGLARICVEPFIQMKSLLQICACLLLAVVPSSLFAQERSPDGATHVQVEAAAKLVKEKKVDVIDVRTADEFAEGHIAGAKNIDVMKGGEFEAKLTELDKSKPYLVHCQTGGRSSRSLKVFKKLGFEKIYHLDGGMGGWQAAGKPVVK